MPTDFYSPPAADEPKAQEPVEDRSEQQQDDDSATALIPKSLLGDKEFKAGDEVVLKIVHIYEDEVEVEYAKEGKEDMYAESESAMDSAVTGE